MPAFRGAGAVQRQEVGLRQHRVEIDQFDVPLLAEVAVGIRLVGDDPHAEADAAGGGRLADAAQSDQPQGLPHHAGIALARPFPHAHLAVEMGKAPGDRHQQRDGVFGHRVVIDAGGDADRDAGPVARLEIDGIVPHTGPGDGPQLRQRFNHPRGIRLGPRQHRIRPLQHANQLVFLEDIATLRGIDHIKPMIMKDLVVRTFLGNLGGDDNLGHGPGDLKSGGRRRGGETCTDARSVSLALRFARGKEVAGGAATGFANSG